VGAGGQAVLDRVVMNVVQVALQVAFVSDGVLPETTLPHVTLAVLAPGVADHGLWCLVAPEGPGEEDLHPPDPAGVVRIPPREGLEEVGVVREDDRRRDAKRGLPHDLPEGPPEAPDLTRGGEDRSAAVGDDRQEEGASRHVGAAVARHAAWPSRLRMVGRAHPT
jgi:hypothetical protein